MIVIVILIWVFVISAQKFGLPYLSAYPNSLGSNFSHGANFATAGSTIRIPNSIIPNGRFSPFSLGIQYLQFSGFIPKTKLITQQGDFRNIVLILLLKIWTYSDLFNHE